MYKLQPPNEIAWGIIDNFVSKSGKVDKTALAQRIAALIRAEREDAAAMLRRKRFKTIQAAVDYFKSTDLLIAALVAPGLEVLIAGEHDQISIRHDAFIECDELKRGQWHSVIRKSKNHKAD